MAFVTNWSANRSIADTEKNDGTEITITAGYVDPNKSIQDMIMAGERLNSFRYFDDEELLENEDYATAIAQIRHPNTDISEIQTYTAKVNADLADQVSKAERRAKEQELDIGGTYKSYDQPIQPTIPPQSGD